MERERRRGSNGVTGAWGVWMLENPYAERARSRRLEDGEGDDVFLGSPLLVVLVNLAEEDFPIVSSWNSSPSSALLLLLLLSRVPGEL